MQMQSSVKDGKHVFGGDVSPEVKKILADCPSPEDIHNNIDSLNEEITESWTAMLASKEEASKQARLTVEQAAVKLRMQSKPSSISSTKPQSSQVTSAEKKQRRVLTPQKSKVLYRRAPDPHFEETKMLMAAKGVPQKVIDEYNEQNKFAIHEVNMSEKSMSLDDELEELDKKVVAAQAEDEAELGLTKNRAMEALRALPNAPSDQLIAKWKSEYGEDGVHISFFSSKEPYIYRHLSRSQWQKVQEMIAKMQASKSNVSEDEIKEKVVMHCILWPSLTLEWKYNSRAGVVDALYQAIMLQSYFLSPQQIMALTTEL